MSSNTLDFSQLFQPQSWNDVAQGYGTFLRDHLARYAADALAIANLGPADDVLDVATGPGTLALQAAETASVVALDFSAGMLQALQANVKPHHRLRTVEGDGQALPFESDSFDAAFSMFGLFMFPDRAAGFSELARVLRPGGRAVVSSWQSFAHIDSFRVIESCMEELMPETNAEPPPRPLADPDLFHAEMSVAGFDVTIHESTHTMQLPSLDALWEGMRNAHVAIGMARAQFAPADYIALERRIHDRLRAEVGGGPQQLEMRAWLGFGSLAG